MLDEKGTTTTWQDNHSGRRGHKLMTKELGDTIPAMGANENADDYDEVLAPAKLFSPYTDWNWYITVWDPKTGLCFGLVEGFETEIGYFHLTELSEVTVLDSVPAVERDQTFACSCRGTFASTRCVVRSCGHKPEGDRLGLRYTL